MKTIEECVVHYKNHWEKTDGRLFEGIRHVESKQRLSFLSQFCTEYSVARNLPRIHDVGIGVRRYKPLLDLVDNCRKQYSEPKSAEEMVPWLTGEIAIRYGGRRALSLSSKLLWFMYRSPIIIYDQLAREALNTPNGNYGAYVQKWNQEFNKAKKEIINKSPCHLAESWFYERVFDFYLWNIGNEIRIQRNLRRQLG